MNNLNDEMEKTEQDSYHYYLHGLEKYEKGDLDAALSYFLKSLELDEHFKTYELLYHIFKRKKLKKEADEAIFKAYRLNPRNDKVATELACMLIDNGKTKVAKKILLEVLKRNPDYGPAKRLLEM